MNIKKHSVFKRLIDYSLIILPVILIYLLWYVKAKRGTLNTSIVPTPDNILLETKYQIIKGFLKKHITASLLRVIKGYLTGSIFGLIVGILSGLFPKLHKLISAPTGFLRSVPAIALIPFFILLKGIGEESKTAIIAFGSFWPVLINTIQGISSTDKKVLEVGKVLCKNKIQMLTKIILPASLPSILTGLRLGISSAWTCVVAAEMIAAPSGIGFLITFSREMANPAGLFLGIFVIGVFGVVIDFVFEHLSRRLIYWH